MLGGTTGPAAAPIGRTFYIRAISTPPGIVSAMRPNRVRLAALLVVGIATVAAAALFIRQRVRAGRARLDPQVVIRQPILPGRSLGPISLGMTEAQVVAALGKPQATRSPRAWQYRDPDIAVNFSGSTPRTVVAIFAGGGPPLVNVPYRTPEGLGVGSTRDEVIMAWGNPENETAETLTYLSRGIVLMHRNGVISWLAVRGVPTTQPAASPLRPF